MNFESLVEATIMCEGHAETQSWHAVHLWATFATLCDPGGVIGHARCGRCLFLSGASPPSTVFSAASETAVEANVNIAAKNPLLVFVPNFAVAVSAPIFDFEPNFTADTFEAFLGDAPDADFAAVFAGRLAEYEIAEFLHLPMQSKQSTHLE